MPPDIAPDGICGHLMTIDDLAYLGEYNHSKAYWLTGANQIDPCDPQEITEPGYKPEIKQELVELRFLAKKQR